MYSLKIIGKFFAHFKTLKRQMAPSSGHLKVVP